MKFKRFSRVLIQIVTVSAALQLAAYFSGFAFAQDLTSQPDDQSGDPTTLSTAIQDIPNFHVVDGAVFRGGTPTAAGLQTLAELNVQTIIDLQGGDLHGHNPLYDLFNFFLEPGERKDAIVKERKIALQDGIYEFYNIPLNSNDSVSTKEERKIDKVLSLLHDNDDHPVYVHCQHGKDRTGLIVALYQVKYNHMTPDAAHEQMVSLGHNGALDLFFTGKLDQFFWKVAPAYYSQGTE